MSWIKENKFVASTIGTAVVVSGVLLYLGYSSRSDARATMEKSNASVAIINRLKASSPYPDGNNKKKVIARVNKYAKDAVAFQDKLVAFKPDEMVQFSDSGFATVVSEHRNSLTNYYREKGVALHGGGENVAFGLEEYRGGALAKTGATKFLNYQRSALDWMFKALADSEPTSLDNVFRTKLAEESGEGTEAPARKPRKSQEAKPAKLSVYRELPIEVTFTGNEVTLKKFLAKLSNAEKYFFVTRSVTINNLERQPPNKIDTEFGGNDSLSGADAEVSSFAAADRPVIKQVTGTEELKVHLKLGLLIFKDAAEVTFPKTGSRAKSTASNKSKKDGEALSSEEKESVVSKPKTDLEKAKTEKIEAPIQQEKSDSPESNRNIK